MVIFAIEKFGMQELSEQELVRREKLAKLRELGIDPYPAILGIFMVVLVQDLGFTW